MKLLWLSNMIPGVVEQKRSGRMGNGRWIDKTLEDLRAAGTELLLLCRGPKGPVETLDSCCRFQLIGENPPEEYIPEMEEAFCSILRDFKPDVIHIWGTEYSHALAMVNAAGRENLSSRVVISIQGLCGAIASHYAEGLPQKVQKQYTVRDLLRRDNILCQQKKYEKRGLLEQETLKKACHVIGRTDWDRQQVERVNGNLCYHHCNETLRTPFYEGVWQYDACKKHRIFVSSCDYPVKGFHYLLQALPEILKAYPDTEVVVPGRSYLPQGSFREKLRRNSYQNYLQKLTESQGLTEKIRFLGGLDGLHMKENFLNCNLFLLCSTVENSPNSLGEAMILGVPSVAAAVGGVPTMLKPREGILYESGNVKQLAEAVKRAFSMEQEAETMGRQAAEHAKRTHDPRENLGALQNIYREIAGEGEHAV